MKLRNISIVLLCAFSLIGCFKDPESIDIIDIEEEIIVGLWQKLSSNGASIQILLNADIESCEESTIVSSLINTGEHLELNLESIEFVQNCDQSLDGIIKLHDVPLADINSIPLRANIGNLIKNDATLTNQENNYTLKFNSSEGIRLGILNLNKMPENICWGYLVSDTNINVNAQEELLSALSNHQSLEEIIRDGEYGYFHKNEDQSIYVKNEILSFKGFAVEYEDIIDWENLKTKANQLMAEDSDLKIFIQNYKGEIYSN